MDVVVCDTSTGRKRVIELRSDETFGSMKVKLMAAFPFDTEDMDVSVGGHPVLLEDTDLVSQLAADLTCSPVDVAPTGLTLLQGRLRCGEAALRTLPEWARERRECVLAALEAAPPRGPVDISPALRGDAEVMLAAIARDPAHLHTADPALRSNAAFALQAVRYTPTLYWRLSDTLRSTTQIALAALPMWPLDPACSSNREVVLAALQSRYGALKHASHDLRTDPDVARTAIEATGDFEGAAPELRSDKPFVMDILRTHPQMLEHATPPLRDDAEVVRTAVEQDPDSIRHASARLRNDIPTMLPALRASGGCLAAAGPAVRADKRCVLAALARCTDRCPDSDCLCLLQCASPQLRGDRDVVVAAVRRHAEALRYASEELRGDSEVLAAVQEPSSEPTSTSSGSDGTDDTDAPLEDGPIDREGVLAALAACGGCLGTPTCSGMHELRRNPDLQGDRDVVLAARPSHPDALRYASEDLRADGDVVLASVRSTLDLELDCPLLGLRHAGLPALADAPTMRAAVSMQPSCLPFTCPEVRDKAMVLDALGQGAWGLFPCLEPCMQADRDVAAAAAQCDDIDIGWDHPLLAEKGFVLELLEESDMAFCTVPECFRADRDAVMLAVRHRPAGDRSAYSEASPALQCDRDVALAALEGGTSLADIRGELRGDKGVVLAAVEGSSGNVAYACDAMRDDGDIGLAAAAQSFGWLSDRLRGDKRVALEAVSQDPHNFIFASTALRDDTEVALAALSQPHTRSLLMYCSISLQSDRDVVLAAVRSNSVNYSFVGPSLQGNAEVLAALQHAHQGAAAQSPSP